MSVLNGVEYQTFGMNQLPLPWRSRSNLDQLETFLQKNWEQRTVFYQDPGTKGYSANQQFIDFERRDGIRASNYIGTISFMGHTLNIFPKIYQPKNDRSLTSDGLDIRELSQDLANWFSYSEDLKTPFLSFKDELQNSNDLIELFITVYLHYLRSELHRQHYHQYVDVRETGSYIRGKIDLKDYIRNKYPTGSHHLLDFDLSNFQFDNDLNRIIKCTCQYLMTLSKEQKNQELSRSNLMHFVDVTDTVCTPYDCDKIHLGPMHRHYQVILDMSRMFLVNKISAYASGTANNFCFLFPAEKLFEDYISGLLKEMVSGTALVKTQTSDMRLAELHVDGESQGGVFELREDILIQKDNLSIVLDTKYKEISSFDTLDGDVSVINKKLSISDDDMKQMLTYGIKRNADRLYLIYPLIRGEDLETTKVVYEISLTELGLDRSIPVEILRVPFASYGNPDKAKQALSVLDEIVAQYRDSSSPPKTRILDR